jgi:hypothetical protein
VDTPVSGTQLRLGCTYKVEVFRERDTEMHFSRLLLIVAAALPLSACFMTAEEIAANDHAVCRSAGLKPGTPAYVRCREDRTRLRVSQIEADRAQQRMFWAMHQANQQQFQMQQFMMRH